MVSSTRARPHVLDFLIDDDGDCAITVLEPRSHIRYHIIAAREKLLPSDSSKDSKASKEFDALVTAARSGESGKGSSTSAGEADSGIHISDTDSTEQALQDWILAPVPIEPGSRNSTPPEKTLRSWLDAPLRFFQLQVDDEWERLEAIELEDSPELRGKVPNLEHEIALPKYILKHQLPWHSADNLVVLAASDAPPPYHPVRVRDTKTDEVYFFKAVDSVAPQTTKRELKLLQRIAQPDLRDRVRAPVLKGLVSSSSSSTTFQSHAIGFLQSEIHGATPLTMKLDSDVPQRKRERWAREVAAMKEALHEHGVIWGDAKADNFLVDADDVLWMIDFGGSYTEGWVDKDLNETEEGDTMGTDKIVAALRDPDANTMDPEVEKTGRNSKGEEDSANLFVTKKSSPGQRALEEMEDEERDQAVQVGEIEEDSVDEKAAEKDDCTEPKSTLEEEQQPKSRQSTSKRPFEEVDNDDENSERTEQPPLKQVHQAMVNPPRAAKSRSDSSEEGT